MKTGRHLRKRRCSHHPQFCMVKCWEDLESAAMHVFMGAHDEQLQQRCFIECIDEHGLLTVDAREQKRLQWIDSCMQLSKITGEVCEKGCISADWLEFPQFGS